VKGLEAFGYPAFGRYQAGRVASLVATQVGGVAVGWHVYATSGSVLDLGLVGGVQFIPVALGWPITGTIADRRPRRTVLLWGMALELAAWTVMAGLAAVGAPVGAFLAALFVAGCARAVKAPAATALLPNLVPAALFPNAVSLNSSLFALSVVGGPAIGGAVYAATGGAVPCFLMASALSAFASVVYLDLPPVAPAPSTRAATMQDALDGIRFIRAQPVLLAAITLDLFAVLLGGAVALLPVYAKDILHVGPDGLGWLRASPAMGAALLAIVLARWPITRRAGPILLAAVAGFGAATIGFGLSREMAAAMFFLFVAGATDEVSVFIRHVIVQRWTPDGLRGRVSAAEFVFIGASNELGEMESGMAAAAIGPVAAVVLGGVGSLAVVAVTLVVARDLRRLDTLERPSGAR
jgi:MFS family permease